MAEDAPTEVVVISSEDPPADKDAKIQMMPSSTSTAAPMPKTRQYYGGDIVVKRSGQRVWEWTPIFGTVMRSSPEGDGSSDNKPTSTSFNVLWDATNQVEVAEQFQVALADRFLTRNMKVENLEGEVGSVSNVHLTATVQIIGTNHVVERVTLERLRPITSFIRGQEILYKDWVGVITTVRRNIWFLLDGGMGFYIPMEETDGFMKTDPYWGVGVACPGIRTKLSSAMMRTAQWTSGPMKFFSRWVPAINYFYSFAHCTINKSEVTEIQVKWLQRSPTAKNSTRDKAPMPEKILTRDKMRNVTVIGIPSSETVGINSVRMLKLKPEDSLTTYTFWLEAFRKRYIEGDATATARKSHASYNAPLRVLATERVYEIPVKVLHRQTVADVAYSNGNINRLSSVKSKHILAVKDDSEFPQGFVVAPMYTLMDLADYYGIVLESDELAKSQKRKVNVMWISNGNTMDSREESVFNLRPHPMYSMYQRGTIVFPRSRNVTKFKSAVVSDLNIAVGRMIVTVTSDNSQHEIYPHTVLPLSQRCFWNFFLKKWVLDDILPPPYHIEAEFDPSKTFVEVSEPSADILISGNNNASEIDMANDVKTVWDELPFELLAFAPVTHRFYRSMSIQDKSSDNNLMSVMAKEISVLKEHGNLPEGVWVRCYENRMDLLSVLMVGPSSTPYEDGLFMFDIQVSANLATTMPKVHYISYSYEINPMMGWDGNFCSSRLNWSFAYGSPDSYIANFLGQIQELIFSPEPYFSDARKNNLRQTSKGQEAARRYNENALLRVLDSCWNMVHSPCEPWTGLIKSHFSSVLPEKLGLYESWNLSEEPSEDTPGFVHPSFLLAPVSEGFQEAFTSRVEKFKKIASASLGFSNFNRSIESNVLDATADSESITVPPAEDSVRIPSRSGSRGKLEVILELLDPKINANTINVPEEIVESAVTVMNVETVIQPPEETFLPSVEEAVIESPEEIQSQDVDAVSDSWDNNPMPCSSPTHCSVAAPVPIQEEDSQKNIVKSKSKGKGRKNRKGKLLKGMMSSRRSSAGSSASASSVGEESDVEMGTDTTDRQSDGVVATDTESVIAEEEFSFQEPTPVVNFLSDNTDNEN